MERKKETPKELKPIDEKKLIWELPKTYKKGMRVPARIYASKELIMSMDPGVFDQVTNVATLPGIQKYSICHADGHWGYGFPIGGVAAFDLNEGVISPGGIGFDINCGMRLIKTDLNLKEVQPKIKELVNELFKLVPAGVGCKSDVRLPNNEFKKMTEEGVNWAVDHGMAWEQDLDRIEDRGNLKFADASKISERAIKRGFNQLGTLGSGNHYLEVQINHASGIFNKEVAKEIGIHSDNQVLVMVHCGSRGVGHQIATDYLKVFDQAMKKYNITVPDRELSCAPFQSEEGQNYYKAMACAANMAYANRQVITHKIRKAFSNVFKKDPEKMGMELIMDNTHNLARKFKLKENGKSKEVLVHLKGATRSLGPNSEDVLPRYKKFGSMIVIGGSMESGSYLFAGTKKAEEETFGTTAHGAGRTMSRSQAKREIRGDILQKDLEKRGIYIKAVSMPGLAEEAGRAYKNIDAVADSLEQVGISKRIIRLSPIGNIKG
mgnify:CR=1 FL=1